MATLPDASGLGNAPLRPALDIAQPNRLVYRPGGIGEATSRFGNILQKNQDEQDQLQYATARSAFLQQKVALETQVQNDPNWQAAGATYADGIKTAQRDALASIPNANLAKRFQAESDLDVATGAADVDKFVHGKKTDQARGDLDGLLETNRTAALSSPSTAPGLITSSMAAIDGARAQGYVSDVEAVNLRQKWSADYGKGYLTLLGPAAAYRLLTGHPSTTGGAPIDMIPALEGSGDTAVSPKGAIGRYQIMPGTAKQFGFDPKKLTDPDYAKTAAQTILNSFSTQVGGDPEATLVAYNAGPAAARRWLASGKNPAVLPAETRAYLAHAQRLGTIGNGDTSVGNGYEPIVPKTGTPADFVTPDERATLAREYFRQAQVEGSVNRQAQAQTIDDQVAFLRSGGDPSKVTITPQGAAAAIGGPEGDRARTVVQQALDYNHAARELALAPPDTVNKILTSAKPDGTVDFAGRSQDFNNLRTIVQQRQAMLTTDPASYAVSADPVAGKAYENAQASPAAFDAYVSRLNGTYTQLGQPPDKRNILPVTDAKQTVAAVVGAKPQDGAAHLAALQQTAGKWWPKVFGELVRNGLPATYQAVSIAAPHDQTTMLAALQHKPGELEQAVDLGTKTGGKDDLDNAIDSDPDLASLRSSFNAYGSKGIDLYASTRGAVRQTALYLMNQGQSAADAATHAAAMVTGPFDFMPSDTGPPARLPKGLLDQATAATQGALERLTDKDVRPYGHLGDETGAAIPAAANDLRDAALHGAKSAWWMTMPGHDGQPILRAIDPQTNHPVMVRGPSIEDRTSPQQAFSQNQPFVKPGAGNFNTALSTTEEKEFRGWLSANHVAFNAGASVSDYDMRGFWKAMKSGNPLAKGAIDPNDQKFHWPDYWKTPYSATFSAESQWANKATAPTWKGDKLVTPAGHVLYDDAAQNWQPLDVPLYSPIAARAPGARGVAPVVQTASPAAIGGLKIPSTAPKVKPGKRLN